MFLLAAETGVLTANIGFGNTDEPAATAAISSSPEAFMSTDPQWRLTRFGWQSKHDWLEKHTRPLEPWAIHPLLWAPALVLLLLTAMIWTTEEWEFDQMFPTAAGTGKC